MTEPVTVESQKSPILSQPKTIRFPAKQQDDSKKETRKHTTDSIHCRWDNCHAHFDTSGALLEHLQVGDDNLISQTENVAHIEMMGWDHGTEIVVIYLGDVKCLFRALV